MSFGNSYNGGRTKMGTKVFLNLYDLSPMNDYLVPVGFGLHHSGIEISGTEYSFGSGGGIFEGPPKQASGARFRYQLEMGTFEGGSQEVNKALDALRHDGFGNSQYNLVKRNCNHFCNALVWKLLKIRLPGYVNRWADLGNCCSCLLPKHILEDSPVGGSGNKSDGSSSFLVPTSASMNRGKVAPTSQTFSGTGHSLGGGDESNSSGWTKSSSSTKDDLTDRREKARKAALARLEKGQQQQQEQTQ
ncbi:MAG: hypothetical protein SGBAC_001532 [Bacillariaceae sp.]